MRYPPFDGFCVEIVSIPTPIGDADDMVGLYANDETTFVFTSDPIVGCLR